MSRVRDGSGENGGGKTELYLAVFGKHPGWNDHIDDQGVETGELAELKRQLYLDGIGGNIDAGTWDGQTDADHLDGFAHVFVARRRGWVIGGRMWASTDGKGRSRYPMIVCVQVPESKLSWLCTEGLLRLEDLEEEFKSEQDAAGVIAAADRARSDLRQRIGEAPRETASATTATRRLADSEAMGPDRLGMHRLLYQMEREASAFVAWRTSSIAVDEARGQAIRVPRVSGTVDDGIESWLRFCQEHLRPQASVLVVAPRERGWVDLLIGPTTPKEMACLLAGTESMPLVTRVPYTIDDSFRDEANALIDREASKSVTPAAEPSHRAELRSAVERISKAARGGAGASRSKLIIGGVLATALLFALAMLALSFAGGGSKDKDEAESPAASEAKRTPPAKTSGPSVSRSPSDPVSFGEAERAEWARWCTEYNDWVLPLDSAAGGTVVAEDAYLRERLLEPMRAELDALDPRRATRASVRSIERLAAQPPSDVQTVEGKERMDAALGQLDRLKEALSPGAWGVRGRALELAERFESRGAESLSAELRGASEAISFEDGAALPGAIERLMARVDAASGLDELLARGESAAAAIEASGDAVAGGAGESLDAALAEIDSLEEAGQSETRQRLESRVSAMESAAAFVGSTWEQVDSEQLHASEDWARLRGREADGALLREWMALASEDRFRMLPDGEDPRQGWGASGRIGVLRAQIASLIQNATSDGAREEYGSAAEALGVLDAQIEELGSLRWTVASRDRIETGIAEVDAEVDGLARFVERSQRAAAASFEEYVQSVRAAESATGSAVLNEAWRQRRNELLARFRDAAQRHQLQDAVERLEDDLGAIDAAFVRAETIGEVPGVVDAAMARRLFGERRESAIAQVLGSLAWEGEGFAGVDASALEQAGGSFETWVGRLRGSLELAAEVDGRLGLGEPLGGRDDRGSLVSAYERLGRPEDGWTASALSPRLSERVDAMEAVAGISEPAALIRAGLEADRAEVTAAAWRALARKRDWPSDAASLARAGELLDAVRARGTAFLPVYLQDASRDAGRMWVRTAAAAESASELDAIAAQRERFGGRIDALAAHTRANLVIADFKNWASSDAASSASDEEIRGKAAEAARAIRAVGPDSSDELEAWLERLDGLATEDPDAGAEIDLSAFGPGKSGWAAEPSDDLSRVRFTGPGGVGLEFVRVDPTAASTDATTVFLAARELSIRELLAIVGQDASRWEELALAWIDLESAQNQSAPTWRGPRSWEWDARGGTIRPSLKWLAAEGGRVPVYPDGAAPDGPNEDSPVVAISGRAAERVAQWVGCRLPTEEEWQRAAQQHGSGAANLRDATWERQQDHHRALEADRRAPVWADSGMFQPDGTEPASGRDAHGAASDDGVLWFAPTGSGGGGLTHLVGNAAEFVTVGGNGLGVIGGSALSDPQWPTDQALAVPPRMSRSGFADVGVRLAFAVPGLDVRAPLRFRAARAGASAPFLRGSASPTGSGAGGGGGG